MWRRRVVAPLGKQRWETEEKGMKGGKGGGGGRGDKGGVVAVTGKPRPRRRGNRAEIGRDRADYVPFPPRLERLEEGGSKKKFSKVSATLLCALPLSLRFPSYDRDRAGDALRFLEIACGVRQRRQAGSFLRRYKRGRREDG
eukprot:scaffold163697_cov48-Tisochrysis_lutea.AAC.2